LFFERIAAVDPVLLVFEDLQWADSGLLDFIDYLLEWSADYPIFILGLGRPELLSRRPAWPPTIALRALEPNAMTELLSGLIPGLPDAVSDQIQRRADGVPLYAVETVRMLLDRGLVAQEGTRYVVQGDVSDLDVPETLQALIAARLDNLDGAERALLQDAAVIGQTFTPGMLAAVSGESEARLQSLLDALVGKQVLGHVDDVRSAEHGQYVFLQGLLRNVAMSTLSRRDRKAKHLAAARHLRALWGEEPGDVAEVLASHYVAAVEADPEADDAAAIRASACETLEEAGRRAISLALGPEARRHFEHAAELAAEPAARGRLLHEAGTSAKTSGELQVALELLRRGTEVLKEAGLDREAARVDATIGSVLLEAGRSGEAAPMLARAYAALDDGTDDAAFAEVAAVYSQAAFASGDHALAIKLADAALPIAEGRRLNPVLVTALTTKANVLAEQGRPAESTALLTHAVNLAVEQELGAEAIRGYYNLAENLLSEGQYAEAEEQLSRGLTLARRRGDRQGERWLNAQQMLVDLMTGRWGEVLDTVEALRAGGDDRWAFYAAGWSGYVLAHRGEVGGMAAALGILEREAGWAAGANAARFSRAVIVRESGDPKAALPEALGASLETIDRGLSDAPLEFAEAVDCAVAAGEPAAIEELLQRVDALAPVQLLPLLDAEAARARALLAGTRGDSEEATLWFRRSIDLFRELMAPFHLARARIQFAELLGDTEDAAVLRREAAEVFGALEAGPWLERARAAGSEVAV
jgi:tetratricopeptide (TPR) repeat protein